MDFETQSGSFSFGGGYNPLWVSPSSINCSSLILYHNFCNFRRFLGCDISSPKIIVSVVPSHRTDFGNSVFSL